jgi:xylulokinase
MSDTHFLVLDIGTGSVRAALVDQTGKVLEFANRTHEQIVPRFGWSEQRAADWWAGAVAVIREVVASAGSGTIAAVAACGQMHGTVLIDAAGTLCRETVPLWNDKRTLSYVAAWEAAHTSISSVERTANPATAAWPAFKLQWLRDNDPDSYDRAETVLAPKDYVNFRLTGKCATDWTEASASFLIDPRLRNWSPRLVEELGLDVAKLPNIRESTELLGAVTTAASAETGLRVGTPVIVGGADFPVALLGSGAWRPGLASDITGTSAILTVIGEQPVMHPEITNVAVPGQGWGAFTLIDSGGDAVRWALRALGGAAARDYEAATQLAATAPAGASNLFFLPFLSGERLGKSTNSRAQFFGLTAAHGPAELHRAVLEGVGFALRRQLAFIAAAGSRPERFIAGSAGAKSELWLRIKASMYGVPVLVPAELESGVLGCAMLAAVALGRAASLAQAVEQYVAYSHEVLPDPAWQAKYDRMAPIFDALHENARARYDEISAMENEEAAG